MESQFFLKNVIILLFLTMLMIVCGISVPIMRELLRKKKENLRQVVFQVLETGLKLLRKLIILKPMDSQAELDKIKNRLEILEMTCLNLIDMNSQLLNFPKSENLKTLCKQELKNLKAGLTS